MTPYTLRSAPSAGWRESDSFAYDDSRVVRARSVVKGSRERHASLQDGLQRMEEEVAQRLAAGQDSESTEGVIELRREMARLRAQIEQLRNFPAVQDEEEPPPSYAPGSYVAV